MVYLSHVVFQLICRHITRFIFWPKAITNSVRIKNFRLKLLQFYDLCGREISVWMAAISRSPARPDPHQVLCNIYVHLKWKEKVYEIYSRATILLQSTTLIVVVDVCRAKRSWLFRALAIERLASKYECLLTVLFLIWNQTWWRRE